MIYADNAATTKLDKGALDAMMPWLTEEYGNASQKYSFARNPKKAITEARCVIADCIGALPEEIYFTSGGTESDNWAIKGLMNVSDYREIITSKIEHHAVLNACSTVERMGFPVTYLPVDYQGSVSPDVLMSRITDNTKLVSIMLVNNEIGTIEPVAELAQIAHSHGSLFHTDAVQAVGHISIDVKALGVDMLSASAHKFNGPKGIGFLYIKKGTKIAPFVNGGAQEFGLRAGTENVASIVGMAVALKNSCDSIALTEEKLRRMEQNFINILKTTGLEFIHNGAKDRVPGNISISIRGKSGEMLLHRLDLKGIYISTGSACDSHSTRISHVIEAIKVPEDYAKGTIRISFGRENKESDAIEIAQEIIRIVE